MSHHELSARGLTAQYDAGPPVLRGADIVLRPARRLAIVGANGSGKSTLLSCLAGNLRPTGGQVLLDGEPLRYNRRGLREHRTQVQLVLQDPDDQLFSADVERDVSFGPANLGLNESEVRTRVHEAVQLLDLTGLRDRPVHQLSHGQKKRVTIAGALAMRPCVLLLDEPTAGLDPRGVHQLMEALRRIEQHHTTVALSTHDVALALEWADDLAVVDGGRVTAGAPADVLGDAALLARSGLQLPWPLAVAQVLAERGLVAPTVTPRHLADLVEALAEQPAELHRPAASAD